MKVKFYLFTFFCLSLFSSKPSHAIFGSELIPLLELVSGQIRELEQIAQTIEISRENLDLIYKVNTGIDQTIRQLESIERANQRRERFGKEPIENLRDVNSLLQDAKSIKQDFEETVGLKLALSEQLIEETAEKNHETNEFGDDLIRTGEAWSQESKTASPGRSAQISAAADSASVIAKGHELKTLTQIASLQAMQLDLQKTLIEQNVKSSRGQTQAVKLALGDTLRSKGRAK